MNQHPVPQHIASFEFKLFGNLTIRQFVALSIPMSVAALIFFSPGPTIIRFPFSIFFAGLGLFAALVPVQGRPFDKWVVAFTRAILSPTQRVWVKEAKIPQFLNIIINQPKHPNEPPQPITFQDRQRLSQYLRSLPKSTVSPLDVREQQAIEKLGLVPPVQGLPSEALAKEGKLPPSILWTTAGPKTKQAFVQTTEPILEERFQGIMPQALPQITPLGKPATAVRISPHAKPYALPGLEKRLAEKQILVSPTLQLASNTNFSIENIIPIPGKHVRLLHGLTKSRTRKLHFAPPKNFNLANLPVRGEARFEVSEELKKRFQFNEPALQPIPQAQETPVQTPKIEVEPQRASAHQAPRPPKQNQFVPRPQTAHFTAQNATLKQEESERADSQMTIRGQKVDGTKSASILERARIIPLTNTPNVLSGLVSDAAGIPLEGAIITVRDQSGIPVRALKTNKLGQFLSTTPLISGVYSLEIEHTNARFEPITINLIGNIVVPLEIKAKG
ncbi:MAG: PrgI family protein [Candidatus Curtissbacteria bacterium]|nr:PrgI family protein [Candidatus Curtissbacteria bacterium]